MREREPRRRVRRALSLALSLALAMQLLGVQAPAALAEALEGEPAVEEEQGGEELLVEEVSSANAGAGGLLAVQDEDGHEATSEEEPTVDEEVGPEGEQDIAESDSEDAPLEVQKEVEQNYAVLHGDTLTFYWGVLPEESDDRLFVGGEYGDFDSPGGAGGPFQYVVDDADRVVFDESLIAEDGSSHLRPTSTADWFTWSQARTFIGLDRIDMSRVTDMSGMFENAELARDLPGIESWDVSNVTNMSNVFVCSPVSNLDLSGWDVSNVKNYNFMFDECYVTSLDLSGWNTKQATNLRMFRNNERLKRVTLGKDFSFKGATNDSGAWAQLNDAPTRNDYDGTWVYASKADGVGDEVPVGTAMTARELRDNYDGATMAGTWEWNIPGYTVRFDANGGTGAMDEQSFKPGMEQKLQANGFIHEAARFVGWNTEADGTGDPYDDEETVCDVTTQNHGIVTLYAQWEGITPVAYVDDNGTGQVCRSYVPIDENSCTEPLAGGWYVARGTVSLSERLVIEGEVHLILCDGARLEAKKGVDLASGNRLTVYAQKGGTGTLEATAPVGCAGIGGNQQQSAGDLAVCGGTVVAQAGEGAEAVGRGASGSDSGGVTLYRTAKVTHGSSAQSDEPSAADERANGCRDPWVRIDPCDHAVSVYAPTADKSHHTKSCVHCLEGKDAEGGDTEYAHEFAQKDDGYECVCGLHAYRISFDKNDSAATGNMDSPDLIYAGESCPIPAVGFVCEGHDFAGWNTKADGSGDTYADEAIIEELASNITLYAQWKVHVHTVTFNPNGGTIDEGQASQSVDYGSKARRPANPIRDGHTFVNWYTNQDLSTKYDFSKPVTEDLTLYAKWKGLGPVDYVDEDGSTKSRDAYVLVTEAMSGTTIEAGWYAVLGDVELAERPQISGEVHLILCDGATLTAKNGVNLASGNKLWVYGQEGNSGSLVATALDDCCAGIGGSMSESAGDIVLCGGNITATGAWAAAGIGGGDGGSSGSVSILGEAKVEAKGDKNGAGIGGGRFGSNGEIRISGNCEVEARAGNCAAGIGTGEGRSNVVLEGGPIVITGGKVRAFGGTSAAGIGGGEYACMTSVTIEGHAEVEAIGGNSGPGIGSGYKAKKCGTVTITGGTVTARGSILQGSGGAGIGLAYDSPSVASPIINISGGRVNAQGGREGAGIGGAWRTSGAIVTISGDAYVEATGGLKCPGIGGGAYCDGGSLTVKGGTVIAQGGRYAAGIGGAANGSGSTVEVSGGMVTAIGGEEGAGIGTGQTYVTKVEGGKVSISSGTVVASGGKYGAGIGTGRAQGGDGGNGSEACDLTISGDAKVSATGGYKAAGIGGGAAMIGGSLKVDSSADVTAQAGTGGAQAIGHGAGNETEGTIDLFEQAGVHYREAKGEARQTASYGERVEKCRLFWARITLSALEYVLTLDANDGSEGPGTAEGGRVSPGDGPIDIPECPFANPGHKVIGWNTERDGSGTTHPLTGQIALEEDLTLYAQWEECTYKVHFDPNGGEGTMLDQDFPYDVAQKLTRNAFSCVGYTFAGWKCGDDAYEDEAEVKNLSATNGATVTFVAQWAANSYTVAFDKNAADATGAMEPQAFTYGEAQALKANAFEYAGRHLAGWSTRADGTGDAYADGQEVENLTAEAGGTVTLYAQWELNEYEYTFDPDGGTMDEAQRTQRVVHGGKAIRPTGVRRAGYVLRGWFEDGAQEAYDFDRPATGDLALRARWDALDPVDYVDEGGEPQTRAADGYEALTADASGQSLPAGWYAVLTDVTLDERVAVEGEVHLILCDGATLTASQGVNLTPGNELWVYGQQGQSGALVAIGPKYAAGIGGGLYEDAGDVVLAGGRVTAQGGKYGAGIGSGPASLGGDHDPGRETVGGNVTVYAGDHKATGGTYGAGVGTGDASGSDAGSMSCRAGSFKIYGGKMEARGGNGAAGIGSGHSGGSSEDVMCSSHGGTFEASGGVVEAWGGVSGAGIGTGSCWYAKGRAGVVNISGDAEVYACGGDDAAGIGTGRDDGIGPDVTITGGKVTALGGKSAGAGIGCGHISDWSDFYGSGGTITITGGEVTATARGYGSAGIGGGWRGDGAEVTITGGEVTATGGDGGPGVGSGSQGVGSESQAVNPGSLEVSGGKLVARAGGTGAAGIGGCETSRSLKPLPITVTITGGEVWAYGARQGAGIGGGKFTPGGTITISGGKVVADGRAYQDGEERRGGAGIGSGYSCDSGGTIVIEGDAEVTAIGGWECAGLGASTYGEGVDITIRATEAGAPKVTARGGAWAAGIGGSWYKSSNPKQSGSLTVEGDVELTAIGGTGSAGIGGGRYGPGADVTISGGATVTAQAGKPADGCVRRSCEATGKMASTPRRASQPSAWTTAGRSSGRRSRRAGTRGRPTRPRQTSSTTRSTAPTA